MDDITKTSVALDLADVSGKLSEIKFTAIEQDRELNASEQRKVNKLEAQAEALQDRLNRDARMQAELARVPRPGAEGRSREIGHPSLLVSDDNLRKHIEAIRGGTSFGAREERANVTVATDTGSPGAWGTGPVYEPETLRRFAGIPNSELTGATAQMPSLTLPAGSAGVAEGTASTEFDATDVVNLTTLAYGRWTQVTSFVQSFTDLAPINQAHAVGIARDLNLVDLTAIQTAAGSVTAFAAGKEDLNVRAAILKVAAAAVVRPEDCVVFGTSAALAVVTGYAPANGEDRGSTTTRIFGAKVYVTEAAVAGNVYAFAPTGFQTFSTGLTSASVLAPDSRLFKFGSWVHSTAPGVFIVGAAAGVDVVTP